MKTPSKTSVIALGLGLLVAAPRRCDAGQQGTPGNALNPGRSARLSCSPTPKASASSQASRSPTGLLTIAPDAREGAVHDVGRTRYRAKVEFGRRRT